MTSAILTITCPHCGGKVVGIEATLADQTIACVFCGTELHVPRVGPIVIRERFFEVEPIQHEVNDAGLVKPTVTLAGVIVYFIALITLLVMLAIVNWT
ncbi:MAG TPA: hypothetical protein VGC41_11210 [Kofleriaceae bacterium]